MYYGNNARANLKLSYGYYEIFSLLKKILIRMNSKDNLCPVILAGGSGTRLWPLSRSAYPKQFLGLTSDIRFLSIGVLL